MPTELIFEKQKVQAQRARLLVGAFYYLALLTVLLRYEEMLYFSKREGLVLLPFLKFLESIPPYLVTRYSLFYFLFAVVLCLWFWKKQWARMIFFTALLLWNCIGNSFGKINNGDLVWVYVSFVFALMPTRTLCEDTHIQRQNLLNYIFLAQLSIMSSYTLSGLWKLRQAYWLHSVGLINHFDVEAFPRIIAAKFLDINSSTPTGNWLIEHMEIARVMFLTTIFMQATAVLAVFRSQLHRIYGLYLVCFHIGTYLIMEVNFNTQARITFLFLVGSPFAIKASALPKKLFR